MSKRFDLAKFAAGTKYHDPVTRNVVVAVHVWNDGEVRVSFVDGASPDYRLDGTNKLARAHSLVEAPVPVRYRTEVCVTGSGEVLTHTAPAAEYLKKTPPGARDGFHRLVVEAHEFDVPADVL